MDGKPSGLADAGTYIHTDYSYLAAPARATTLHSIEAPPLGGNPLFANQYAANADLPDALRRRIDDLFAIHHFGIRHDLDETSLTVATVLTDDQNAKMPLITHPDVRLH